MRINKTRIISFILCVAFTLTVWPLATFAESVDIDGIANLIYNTFFNNTDDTSENSTDSQCSECNQINGHLGYCCNKDGTEYLYYNSSVGRVAKFNSDYYYFYICENPSNVEDETFNNAKAIDLNADYIKVISENADDHVSSGVLCDISVIVTEWFHDEYNRLWYKIEAASEYTLPESLISNPWVFQNYTNSPSDDTLILDFSEDDKPSAEEVESVYQELILITTWREWEEYVESLDDDMKQALLELPEDKVAEINRLDEYFYKQKQEEFAPPAVDYTEVAPLVLKTKVGDTEISVEGTMPVNAVLNAASIGIDEIDFTAYDITDPDKVVGAYDIKLINNDQEWQPDDGAYLTLIVAVSSLNVKDGDSVLVHHNHNGVIESFLCVVENGLISVEVGGLSDFILELNDEELTYQYAEFEPYRAVFNKSPVKFYGSHLPDETEDYREFEVTEDDIIIVEAKYIFSDNTEMYVISIDGYEGENDVLKNSITPSNFEKAYCIVSGDDIKAYVEDPSEDVQEVYNLLVSLTSWVDWEDYVETLSDEMKEALLNLPEEQVAEIERLDNYFYKEKVIDFMPPAVDYTEVAPLVSNIYSPVSEVNNNASWRNENSIKSRYNSTEPFKMSYSFIGLNGNTDDPADDKIPNNGLNLNKTAVPDGKGGYTITLEAYTTGNVTPGEAIPSDIILVLDLSTSMNKEDFISSYEEVYNLSIRNEYYIKIGNTWQKVEYCERCRSWTYGCYHSWYNTNGTKVTPKTSATDATSGSHQFYDCEVISRLEALKSAMTSFIGTIADQATEDRIALVGFHSSGTLIYGQSDASALVDATTYETQLLNAISALNDNSLKGATEHGRGMEKAKAVFDAQTTTDYSKRNKVVVMVTDGQPAPSGTDAWSVRTVRQAINAAYDLKKPVADGGHAATVYTISVMPGTDASNPTSDMDKYMTYMSSNYPNAQYTGTTIKDDKNTNGDSSYYDPNNSDDPDDSETAAIIAEITPGAKVTTTGSYYLTAGNLAVLDGIFGNIAEQTGGASIPLDATTQIKDIIAPQFILPDGTDTSKISVTTKDATYDENGSLGWTDSTLSDFNPSVNIEGNNVTVSGFDFTRNFVAVAGREEGDVSKPGSFHGRKLIISFTVNPSDSFLGGNGVYTNGSKSGVYKANGESVEPFNIPDVDVPIKTIDPILENQYIYLTNDADLDAMIAGSSEDNDYRYEYKLGNATYDFDGVNNAYVNVTYYVTDAEGQVIKTLTIEAGETSGSWSPVNSLISGLSEDTTEYKIYCTVTPTTEGTYAAQQGDKKPGKVYVFEPELTFKDYTVDYDSVINGTSYYSNEDSYSYANRNYVSTIWKNDDVGFVSNTELGNISINESFADKSAEMSGTVPTLTFTYEPSSGVTNGKVSATEYVAVNVTVKVGETTITDNCTFIHDNCTVAGETCQWEDVVSEEGQPAFLLHVINAVGKLKIIKTGLNQKTHATTDSYWDQESAIFTVTEQEDYDGDGKIDFFTVVIIADESGYGEVTISNLKHGRIYLISEDSGWTWRYETTFTNGNQATIKGNETVEVRVKNTHEKDKWLDGSTWAVNVFGSKSGTYYDPNNKTGKNVNPQ